MTMNAFTYDLPALRQRIRSTMYPLRRLVILLLARLCAPFYLAYEVYLRNQLPSWQCPRHIGIIMDGNRRFARRLNLEGVLNGHERGAAKLEDLLRWCEEADVRVVTVWIFSMDNFQRDPEEVDGLMELFEKKFLELVNDSRIHRDQVCVRCMGNREALPPSLRLAIENAEAATAHYTRRVLNIGVAYGGREEILAALREYLRSAAQAGKSLEEVCDTLDVESIAAHLYTSPLPEPDLIIRTSGEVRLSGFMLWQSVHSEFYFCDTNWPEFRKIDFLRALRSYSQRKRRYGR